MLDNTITPSIIDQRECPSPPIGTVYLVTNKINGKKYVGKTTQTLKERWKQHIYLAIQGSRFHLHNAIRKYNPDNFLVNMLDECFSEEDLSAREIFHIFNLGTTDSTIGYNMTFGGEGNCSTPEVRRKISQALTGKVLSQETKDKIRLAILGTKYSDEQLINVRAHAATLKGIPRTKEVREKISEALMGKPLSPETIQKIKDTKTSRGYKRKPHSAETRKKIGDANRGRPSSLKGTVRPPEIGLKISQSKKGKPSWHKGRRFSAEHKARLSLAAKGRTVSEETKRKISETLRLKNSGPQS